MKARYLFIAAVVCALLSIVGLRLNHQAAIAKVHTIEDKDQQAQDVAADITTLRKFVFAHMNASVQFELTNSYNRAVSASTQTPSSDDLYAQAQAACDRQGQLTVSNAQCVQDFLNARLQPGINPQPPQVIDRSQYHYAYISPAWTPDFAGLSLLAALGLALMALIVYTLSWFRSK